MFFDNAAFIYFSENILQNHLKKYFLKCRNLVLLETKHFHNIPYYSYRCYETKDFSFD